MSELPVNKKLKRQFLKVWADGKTRPEIAAHFGRTHSWVQYMTEICNAPPRRVTIHNLGRVVGGEPDNRIQRRAYFKVANELKRSMHNLYGRVYELKQIVEACDLAGDSLATYKGFNRILTNIRVGVRTLNRRIEKLRSTCPEDPLITSAEDLSRQTMEEYNRWLALKYSSEKKAAR